MARVEIFQGRARRRWSDEDKRRLVAETFVPGETVHAVGRRPLRPRARSEYLKA